MAYLVTTVSVLSAALAAAVLAGFGGYVQLVVATFVVAAL